jgi:hypothetical protein
MPAIGATLPFTLTSGIDRRCPEAVLRLWSEGLFES